MLKASYLHSLYPQIPFEIDYSNTVIKSKNKICSLGKEIFGYLSRHPYALSIAVFTSFVIQVGIASQSILPQFIDNLESCQQTFCSYSNITDHPSHPVAFDMELYCNKKAIDYKPFSSLQECLSNLRDLYFWHINANWNTACQSMETTSTKKINKHMTRCFKKLCSEDNSLAFFDRSIFEWCPLRALKKIKKRFKKLSQKVFVTKTNEWTKEDMLQISIDLFFDMSNNFQSMLASIVSNERLDKFTPNKEVIHEELNLIKKGTKEMFASSIVLIKGLLDDQSLKELPEKITQSLWNMLEKVEQVFPVD